MILENLFYIYFQFQFLYLIIMFIKFKGIKKNFKPCKFNTLNVVKVKLRNIRIKS